jgi:hypothetical protein
VGTGINAGDRRNALRIDSNNNSNFTGSVRISGSLNTTGKINDLTIYTGSANVNSIGIGNNTLSAATGSSLNNIAIGNNALRLNVTGSNIVAIGGSALENSLQGFNTAIGASALGALVAGEQNMAIGQSAIQALTNGGKNTGIGFNTMVGITSGSFNTAIGAGTLQRNITGSGCVVIGNQAGSWSTSNNEFFIHNDNLGSADGERSGSLFWGNFANPISGQNLQINANTKIVGNTNVTGSLAVSGSLSVGGNLQFNVGAFQSSQSQSGSANVSQSITYNTTDYSQGVSVTSGSQLTIANKGVYNIQFSAQLLADTGADDVYIWLKKNGTNVAGTAGRITLANNEELIATWNYVVDAAANDYYELVWQSSGGDAIILAETATGNIPSVPSIITTVTQVR